MQIQAFKNIGTTTQFREHEPNKDYVEYLRTSIKGQEAPTWFVEDKLGISMFPSQKWLMGEFYKQKKKKLIVAAGMRGGKSALAAMMATYEMFLLMVLPDVSKKYGLIPGQPVFISVVATSTEQATDSVFANIGNMIEHSEWFSSWTDCKVKDTEVVSKKKNVTIRVLSSWSTTAVGRSNKAVVFDELANFEETSGKRGAWEIWSRLSKSTDTFGNDGHIIAISSPKTPTDIIMTLYQQGLHEPDTLAVLKPTWEMNPNLTKEKLMEEHKHNMAAFWRDYAVQPQAASGMEFPEGATLTRLIKNVLVDVPTKPDTLHLRVCAIDPAVRNDAFGMAVGWYEDDHVTVDGVIEFRKVEGDVYLRPSEIREFVDRIVPALNINTLVFDTWMFPELLEHVEFDYGIETVKHIVGKADYDRLRERTEDITIVYEENLENQIKQLLIKSDKKVDHPFSGSKDTADCVANVVWYFLGREDVEENKKKVNKPRLIPLRGY